MVLSPAVSNTPKPVGGSVSTPISPIYSPTLRLMAGMKRFSVWILVLLGVVLSMTAACRRISFIEDSGAKLTFSRDTVKFDTVFTTVGSATRSFKIYNPYNENIRISSIELMGGEPSNFRMNVDGLPGTEFTDLEIAPNDSLYVFVEVTIDPNEDQLPYVIEDSIRMVTNNNEQFVQLVAWGQNAHFYDGVIVCDEVWNNDLPYVIYNSILVDSLCTLTINEGCRIYMHGGSSFYVLGTLEINGTFDSLVTFQADRLENFFEEIPGQWTGISILRSSRDNVIHYASIRNAINGIMVGLQSTAVDPDDLSTLSTFADVSTQPELEIRNSYVYDCSSYGMIAVNAQVNGDNLLIYGTGESNLSLACGGYYTFRHCTLANYGSVYVSHQNPVLSMSDFIAFGPDYVYTNSLEQAYFYNSIIYGNIAEGKEVLLSNEGEGVTFNYLFNHCMIRTELDGPEFEDCLLNVGPLFADVTERNYCPDTLSQAINGGVEAGVPDDILGTPRPFAGTLPDIGCYETYVE